MGLNVKQAGYFNIEIESSASEAYKLLSGFADEGIGLIGFRAVPAENNRTMFSLFPDDISRMKECAARAGLKPDGPHSALMITSDSDEPGECAGIFRKLSEAGIDIPESNGIAGIRGSYGVIVYINPENLDKALRALRQ